jgi:hypothetical protein
MKSAWIETLEVAPPEAAMRLSIDRLFVPQVGGRAEMLEGSPEEVAAKVAELLIERALIRK